MNIWKKNIIEDLESGSLSYITIKEFLTDLKKEFDREENKTIKLADVMECFEPNILFFFYLFFF